MATPRVARADLYSYRASETELWLAGTSGASDARTLVRDGHTFTKVDAGHLADGGDPATQANTQVSTITFVGARNSIVPTGGTCAYLFSNFGALTSINNLAALKTSGVTSMYMMFRNCAALRRLTLPGNFNTGSVTDMRMMFSGCTSLACITIENPFGLDADGNDIEEPANHFHFPYYREEGLSGNWVNVSDSSAVFTTKTTASMAWVTVPAGTYVRQPENGFVASYYDGVTRVASMGYAGSVDVMLETADTLGMARQGCTFAGWERVGDERAGDLFAAGAAVRGLATNGGVVNLRALWRL